MVETRRGAEAADVLQQVAQQCAEHGRAFAEARDRAEAKLGRTLTNGDVLFLRRRYHDARMAAGRVRLIVYGRHLPAISPAFEKLPLDSTTVTYQDWLAAREHCAAWARYVDAHADEAVWVAEAWTTSMELSAGAGLVEKLAACPEVVGWLRSAPC